MSQNPSLIRVAVAQRHPEASPAVGDEPAQVGEQAILVPLVDIHEGDDGLVLVADLPGATAREVLIQLEENVLNLEARVDRRLPQGSRPLYEESPGGTYRRSFILGADVDRGRIAAELKDGVLRVVLPRTGRSLPRRIEVKTPTRAEG